MFRRAGGNFYSRDKITGQSESLGTSERSQAKQLLAARNQAAAQPQLNRTMAIYRNRSLSQEYLIRTLNPIIRGWANYHRHVAASDTYRKVDNLLWQSLWQWAKRRHPEKPRPWVLRRYWHPLGRKWKFAAQLEKQTPDGKAVWYKLVNPADTKIQRHRKIKGAANPFDPHWRPYFEDRAFFKKFGVHRPETRRNPS